MKIKGRFSKKAIIGILAIFVAGTFVGSAGLLNYYGKIENTVDVKQSIRLDGNVYENGYGDITYTSDGVGSLYSGCCAWGNCHELSLPSDAGCSASTEISMTSGNGLTTMIAAEVQDAGVDCSDYTVPTADVTVNTIDDLQTAAAEATPQVIVVEDGTYTGVVNVMNGHTIVAETYLGATIEGGFHIKSNGVTIKGFRIEPNNAIGGGAKKAIYLPDYDDITIQCNEIDGTGISGSPKGIVTITSGDYSNILIENNEIHDLTTGIYLNPHTGNVEIKQNTLYNCIAAIGDFHNADATYNVFYNNGEAIGADDDYTGNEQLKYNNILGSDAVKDYGVTTSIKAYNNWWGCDGVANIVGSVKTSWYTWSDGDVLTLEPGDELSFMIKYCAVNGYVGDYTATLQFLIA